MNTRLSEGLLLQLSNLFDDGPLQVVYTINSQASVVNKIILAFEVATHMTLISIISDYVKLNYNKTKDFLRSSTKATLYYYVCLANACFREYINTIGFCSYALVMSLGCLCFCSYSVNTKQKYTKINNTQVYR